MSARTVPRHDPLSAAEAAGSHALRPAATLGGDGPGLVAAFSTALPRLADAELAPLLRAQAARAWQRKADALPAPVLLRQTHSPRVLDLTVATAPDGASYDGAMAAGTRPRLLAVKTADCVPLLAVDAAQGRYAALHAGWRGAAGGILPNLLAAWRVAGSDLRAVRLELGPHIQGCCYEVQEDCLAAFDETTLAGAVRGEGHRTFLALARVLCGQALRAGVSAGQVHVSAHCTYCHRDADGAAPYASYRRSVHNGEAFAGTNVGLIGILPPT